MTATSQTVLPVYDHRIGAGPTLVFLHYWGGSSRTWDPVLDCLPTRDTLTVDWRGWGRSRELPGPYTLQQLADDLLAVLAEADVADYVLIGHSMGGKVAQLVAATRPAGLRGIVLVGSAPAEPHESITPDYQKALSHAYDSEDSVADVRDHVLTAAGLLPHLAQQVVADSLASADDARTEWPLHGIAEDITDRTAAITVPALVVAGAHDRVEPADVLRHNLVRFLDRADFQIIPATGHLIPLEAPEPLAEAITAFAPARWHGQPGSPA